MKTSALAALALALPALVSAGPGHPHGPPKKPYVSSDKLQSDIKRGNLVAAARKLQRIADRHQGTRVFGSGGHNATVDFLYNTLKSTGYYNVYKQPFTEIFSEGTSNLTVNGAAVASNIMTYTPGGSVTAPFVAVSNLGCDVADFPAGVAGNIALVSRGECTFAQKSLNAKAAGAEAIVIYNNVPGSIAGTLGEPFLAYAPVVGISQEDGQALLAQLSAGPVTGSLVVTAITEDRVTFNVIAETKEGDHNNVLIVGGHTDSVAAGPGLNDNGSGTLGLLEVALSLTKYRVKNAIRFAFWSAEEFGLLGSYFYVNSFGGNTTELSKIRAYLNFDMIASPNYMLGIYDGDGSAFNLTGPAGSDVLEKDFEKFFKSKRSASVPTEFSGRSDYAAFIETGIPAGGLFTGAEQLKTEEEARLFGGQAGVAYDVNYHLVGDTFANLNFDAFLINTKAIANSVAKYALSFATLPPVNLIQRRDSGDHFVARKRSLAAEPHVHSHAGPCGAKDAA